MGLVAGLVDRAQAGWETIPPADGVALATGLSCWLKLPIYNWEGLAGKELLLVLPEKGIARGDVGLLVY